MYLFALYLRQKKRLDEMSWVSRRKEAPIRSKASQIRSREKSWTSRRKLKMASAPLTLAVCSASSPY